jgi:hypothetical protein
MAANPPLGPALYPAFDLLLLPGGLATFGSSAAAEPATTGSLSQHRHVQVDSEMPTPLRALTINAIYRHGMLPYKLLCATLKMLCACNR